ncbi:MAG: AraC family transcriptional regulator [Planctomycetota bacterium]
MARRQSKLSGQVPGFISDRVESGRYYFLDSEGDPAAALRVMCGGREVCGPRYEVARQSFRYWALEFVEAGEGEITLGGVRYPLGPGSVYAYGPGIPHRLGATGRRELIKHFIDFSGPGAQPLLREHGLAGAPRWVAQHRWVQAMFDQLLEVGQSPPEFARRQSLALLTPLLAQIEHGLAPTDGGSSAAFSKFCQCRSYLARHFANLTTVAEAAAACGIDPAYCSRLFRRYADEGAHAFLTRMKVSRAAELLAGQRLTVQQAGREVGYDDPYHFSRVFKRVYGVSPQKFVGQAAR